MGGTTATALFTEEFPNTAVPALTRTTDVATRDDQDGRRSVSPARSCRIFYRGSLANPDYRAYLLRHRQDPDRRRRRRPLLRRDQPGLRRGATSTATRGSTVTTWPTSTPICCGDFPGADYQTMFGMTPDNLLKAEVPPGDLKQQLQLPEVPGQQRVGGTSLFSSANPLAAIWGQTIGGTARRRARPTSSTAPSRTGTGGQIVSELRAYAQQNYGRSIYLTVERDLSAGRLPGGRPLRLQHRCRRRRRGGVGAGHVGVDDDAPPSSTARASCSGPFLNLKARVGGDGARRAGRRVPRLAERLHLVLLRTCRTAEQQDYWRIYAAEAYANGLYYAFYPARHRRRSERAPQLGLMPLFQSLTAFYRATRRASITA